MTLHRFCCPEAAPDGGRVRIEGAAAVQIRKVLRLGPGDRIVLFGADEWEYTVQLERVERDAACGAVIARAAPRAEPRCALTLALALLKGEKTEWVLQKGTELGVGRFLLMQTRRTVAVPDERRAAGRQERFRRIVREATEQCGRVRPPAIEGVLSFADSLAAGGPAALLLHERAPARLSEHLERGTDQSDQTDPTDPSDPTDPTDPAAEHRTSITGRLTPEHPHARLTLLVGPEGGFDEEEVMLAAARGVPAVSLGARVLRAETAALAAVALAMDRLEQPA